MDPRLQASFIPKKSLAQGGFHRPSNMPGFFFLAAGLLLALTVAAAVAVFFLNSYESSSIASKNQSIAIAERKYDQASYQTFVQTDKRINIASNLLAKHVALTKFFSLLGAATVQTVSFSNFSYTAGATSTATISMNGLARSFNAVSFQSETFAKTAFLINPVFSGVGLDSKGNVTFQVSSGVDTGAFLYSGEFAPAGSTAGQTASSTSQ